MTGRVRWLFVWCALFWSFAAGASPPEPDCSNPRSAADSMLAWLQPDSYDPARARTCLDLPAGANGERTAVQLKQVLDARGHYVPIPTMTTDPDHTDDNGDPRLVPLPEFPQLVLVRLDDGRWMYSQETLLQVPKLYADTFSPLSQWFQAQLPSVFYNRVAGLFLWQFMYAGLLVLLAWLVGQVVQLILKTQVRRIVMRAKILNVGRATYARTTGPIVALSMALVFLWGIPDIQLTIGISRAAYSLAWVIVALAGILTASRIVDMAAEIAVARAEQTESRLDDQVIPLLRQAARIVLWSVGLLFILQNYGVDVASLIAGLGIGGLAFALAAKDSLANLFGSLNIFLDRPFQIGDWVVIGDVEGTVLEVGFRTTRIRTFYNSIVTVPNSSITNANVDNMGLRNRRRIKMRLGVTYNTPVETLHAFVEGIRAILAAHPDIERTYEVHFVDFGASALEILVYYHVVTPTWSKELEARSQNLMEIMRLAEQLEVSFAFPSTSLYVEATPDKPLVRHTAPALQELEAQARAFGPGGSLANPDGPQFENSFTVSARTDRGS